MLNTNQTLLRLLLRLDCPLAATEALRTLTLWEQRRRTQSQLRTLDAQRLADIGLTDHARGRECAKWFWEA